MTRRGAIRLLAGLATVGLLAGCDLFTQRATFRVRMTVEVQTAQGLKSGSSVMEMSAQTRVAAGTQSTARYSAGLSHGEAVVVDLPDGPLFVLLTIPDAKDSFGGPIFDALNGDGKPLTNDDMMAFVSRMGSIGARYRGYVRRELWPLMVQFADIANPTSVERVDPVATKVTRIMVETTNDPVTVGIEKRLVWLPNQKGSFQRRLSSPDPTNPSLAATLNSGDFSTEIGR